MTMPDERMRALRWGLELLNQMKTDPLVPDAQRDRARELQAEYPGWDALERLVVSDTGGLCGGWACALSESRNLFIELQAGGHGSVETSQRLRSTLRHFPEHWEIGAMEKATALRAWLQTEGQRR